MKTLTVFLIISLASPVYAYVNYNSSGDPNPAAYNARIQQEQQQDLSQQKQNEANSAATNYYNNQPTPSPYNNPNK